MKQNTQEWLEIRKNHIGASDAPVIMGKSPWKTSYQLWEEKLGLREIQPPNEAMMRGHQLEPIALQAYNNYTENASEPEVVFHESRKWMMASLDGISLDRSIILEIKCPGEKDHELASHGIIPEKYYPQLQHQLAVVGNHMLHYFSYRNGDFHLVEVERNDDFIKELYEKEEEFWNRIQNFDAPPLSDSEYIPMHDDEWVIAAKNWEKSKKELKEIEEKEKHYRDHLIQLAKNQNCEGAGIRVQKIIRLGNVDYKSIPELSEVNLDKYRKSPTNTWRVIKK